MDAQEQSSRECNAAHEWMELKAEREAKRKADAAPDREKIMDLADSVQRLNRPCVSDRHDSIMQEISSRIDALAAWIRWKAGEL